MGEMKICIDALAAKSSYHGIGTYVSNILCHLLPKAQENHFLVLGRKDFLSSLPDARHLTNMEKKAVKLPLFLRVAWEYTLLPFGLLKDKVDIFWGVSHFLPPVRVGRYLVTIHDLASFFFPHLYPLFRWLYHQVSIRNAIQRADYVITPSHSTKRDLIKHFRIPEERVFVVPNGFDETFRYPITDKEREEIKKRYNLPEMFVFALGVLEPRKNTERILLAFASLLRDKSFPNKEIKLVIGGSLDYGWKNKRIFQLVKELKIEEKVIFTGPIPNEDLPAFYAASFLSLYPSLYEGFGLPVIEAQACGTPVITSKISSLPEVAGEGAILVNPYSVEEIARAMKELFTNQNKREELIEKGLENAKRFSWKKAAEEILEIFERIGRRK